MKSIIVGTLASVLAFGASAQEESKQNFYGEVSAGKNLTYSANNELKGGLDGYGFNLSVGYAFSDNLAAEIGFMKTADNINFKDSVDVPYFGARMQLPLQDRLNLITKLGVMKVKTKAEHGRYPFMGIGAGYKLDDKMQATVMYQGAVYGINGAGLLGLGINYSL